MRKFLLKLVCPYRVNAFDGYDMDVNHFAWSAKDALEWAACYPRWAAVAVFNRWGRQVALRRASF